MRWICKTITTFLRDKMNHLVFALMLNGQKSIDLVYDDSPVDNATV